ncbi:MAG: SDR family oxidoreductase [Gemmatimonadaceae bacterium]
MTGQPLEGRVAVVTGASRGIGLAIARALVAAGARVAMLARGAGALADRARELGPSALPLTCDLGDRSAIESALERTVAALGDVSILVNNAGLFHPAPATELTVSSFAETIGVNLVGTFAVVRAVLPSMKAREAGHIVTIGSVADRSALPGNAAYSASKYGARAVHEVIRAELRGSGVRVTLVSPGPTDTSIWDGIALEGSRFPPRQSMLRSEAVADAVLYAVTRDPAVNIDELRLSAS